MKWPHMKKSKCSVGLPVVGPTVIIAHHLVIALLAKEPVRGAARHAVADFVGDGVHGVHRHLLV
ncbi:MAG: hypothetical protein HS113_19200 [Verrucomicrobiales bacterium]|nr:hypothetical protein [Verrucomicrobiales bacterium]